MGLTLFFGASHSQTWRIEHPSNEHGSARKTHQSRNIKLPFLPIPQGTPKWDLCRPPPNHRQRFSLRNRNARHERPAGERLSDARRARASKTAGFPPFPSLRLAGAIGRECGNEPVLRIPFKGWLKRIIPFLIPCLSHLQVTRHQS